MEDRVVSSPGTLFVVATPIGHLGDFSFRGVEVLKAAAVIACEDTRHTRRLLSHYDIDAPLTSLHAHSHDATITRLLDRVEAGENVAYVTDAGAPGISDPGGQLVERAHARGLKVVPIPGPSAVVTALMAAGFSADRFVFLGFLPKRGTARAEMLTRIAGSPFTCVCYEAPGRTVALLQDLAGRCGPERPAAVGRELTKLHEEVRRGTLTELVTYYEQHPARGEVTVVIGSGSDVAPVDATPVSDVDQDSLVRELRDTGAPSAVAKELSKRLGITRQAAYRLLTQ